MTPTVHSLLPKLAIAMAPVLLGVASYVAYRRATRTYDVPKDTDIFQFIEGRWTLTGLAGDCESKRVTIEFTPDHRNMILIRPTTMVDTDSQSDSIAHYPILGHTRHSIQIIRPGETHLDAEGVPVVWDLILRSHNTCAWHRSDWVPFRLTDDIRRCPKP